MINKKNIILLLIILPIILLIYGIFFKGYDKSDNIRLKVIKLENGWGYNIINNQHILIHQPNIPVIQKSTPFKTKRDAKKVGYLVINKIESNKFPVITLSDLDSLKIDYQLKKGN